MYGYPVLLYYKESVTDTQKFIGVYNLNLDKSDVKSFGLDDGEVKDIDDIKHDFGNSIYLDDDFSSDILTRKIYSNTSSLTETSDTLSIMYKQNGEYIDVDGIIMTDTDGNKVAVKNPISNEVYSIRDVSGELLIEMVGKDKTEVIGLLSRKGYIRTITNNKIPAVECFECKANSGAAGAGGFGNYGIDSMTTDMEPRQPDDGDIEDDEYTPYSTEITTAGGTPLTFEKYKTPYYYSMSRMIKWVLNSDENEFIKNIDKHFNRNYLMDYYLTVLLLGGVDSLGKNLMVGTWGPENHLYLADEETLDPKNPFYDKCAFKYTLSNGTEIIVTPTVTRHGCTYQISESDSIRTLGTYDYAEDANGRTLYYKEEAYNRYTKSFENDYTAWDSSVVTTVPGECIWYPMFYDIDTICGLDNSGQLIFDVDIEVGDSLDDGTSVYNTADSNLWTRVRDYMGNAGWLASRWSVLRNDKFTMSNLVTKFFYDRQIAKIPETYYNEDCMLKYIYEGPKEQKGSGSYLYCVHGSRYEQMKRWYSQRIDYLDSMFGLIGTNNASLRFNYAYYDANFNGSKTNYGSYYDLAANNPDAYIYDNGVLYANKGTADSPKKGNIIKPIEFNFKTYQPGYVGLKWSNSDSVHMTRVKRDETVEMEGNVPTSGDAEVFIFGGSNIKEIGSMAPYNVKQIDFRNLTKLSKLIIGDTGYSSVIEKLDLGTNSYLAELNLTNCKSLSTVNVSNCKNLKTINLTGSSVTSITLAKGGALESISYSNSITSINLQNFTNLSTINVTSLNNLNEFVIKNCPKILGTAESYNAKAWGLLQQTKSATSLSTIEVTSYGEVSPKILADGSEFFFPDKFYNYDTSKNIKGEIKYLGSTIPSNYAKFAKAYPKLNIIYANIKDASEMFANYKNLNCISSMTVYTGTDSYGDPKYSTAYYWTDTRENDFQDTLVESQYTDGTKFYVSDNVKYRMLYVYDDKDLDVLRAEIKENLSNFAGVSFTSVAGMFRNLDILDYIDPDTFNSIDLSKADTADMFSGCTNLRYFTMPDDNVKNNPVYIYYNIVDNEKVEVSYEDWIENDENKELKKDSDGNLIYSNPFTGEETTDATSTYPKGIRKINSGMFYNCKQARILIKKLSNSDIINIQPDAFKYVCYDPSKENQEKGVTGQRPVIMFEHKDTELLTTTTESGYENLKYPSAGDNLYFKLSFTTGEREFNVSNQKVYTTSCNWFREVYFGVKEIVINDKSDEKLSLSYALTDNNEKILFRANKINSTTETTFNNSKNSYNIKAICQSALYDIADELTTIYIPITTYDCFDPSIIRQDYEKSIVGIFTKSDFTAFTSYLIGNCMPQNLTVVNIINSTEIPDLTFKYMSKITSVVYNTKLEKIGGSAFEGCTNLNTIDVTGGAAYRSYSSLKSIGSSAFKKSGLSYAGFGSALTSVESSIFEQCEKLNSIDLGGNVTEIPDAFAKGCTYLSSITGVSENLTRIGDNAFYEDTNLEILTDAGGVTFAPTFEVDSNTKNYNFNAFKKLSYIGDNAFYKVNTIGSKSPVYNYDDDGSLLEVVYPDYKLQFNNAIKYIGRNAFYQEFGSASKIFIEIVWGDYTEDTAQNSDITTREIDPSTTDFSQLEIGTNAFYNIRFAWRPETPESTETIDGKTVNHYKLVNDIFYLPKINSIGKTALHARDTETNFKYCVAKNAKSEIGEDWVSGTDKIIFGYLGTREYVKSDSTDGTPAGTYLVAERETSDGSVEKIAYLYKGNTTTTMTINKTISFSNDESKYTFIEIMSNAFGTSYLQTITFAEGCAIEVIGSGIINNYLTTISNNGVANTIPDGLTIEAGNDFKSSNWYSNLTAADKYKDAKFELVTLSRYIIGAIGSDVLSVNDNGTAESYLSLDLSNYKDCDTVYDSAFSETNINSINFGDNIKYIYDKAFYRCPLTTLTLPEGLITIGASAFGYSPLTYVYIPNTVTSIGDSAITGYDNNKQTINSLKEVFIEDGAEFTGNPFALTTELKTGGADPEEVNISLTSFHIPVSLSNKFLSTSWSYFKKLSQIRNLTIGELRKADDGTYNYPNYPMYEDSEGLRKVAVDYTIPDDYSHAIDDDGNKLYCPAFYYDIAKEMGFEISTITTNATDYYPIGDGINSQESVYGGYTKDIDISYIVKYENGTSGDGRNLSQDDINATSDLTEIDIMRIIAGFSSNLDIKTVSIRQTDYNNLSSFATQIIGQKYNIAFKIYKNK